MTNDELTKAFNEAGLDTPEKVSAFIALVGNQAAIKEIDSKLEFLQTEQQKLLEPGNVQRANLQRERNVRLTAANQK